MFSRVPIDPERFLKVLRHFLTFYIVLKRSCDFCVLLKACEGSEAFCDVLECPEASRNVLMPLKGSGSLTKVLRCSLTFLCILRHFLTF